MSGDRITLTKAEMQSGLNRQRAAEGLILQLPAAHDGRNTWLLNYGIGEEAVALRTKHGVFWNPLCEAAYSEEANERIRKRREGAGLF